MKVLVGLSGGVDSSVCAFLLKQQGYEVIGATMSIWGKDASESDIAYKEGCYGPSEKDNIEAARKVAEQIDIPFYVIDCTKKYEEIVLNDFKTEYISGRTPNPCIRCNAAVKFGAFPENAKLSGIEFDKFATGHYVRIEEENGRYCLKRGKDPVKDQSYFLYRLSSDKLSGIITPLGNYTKEEIRKIAEENGLISAKKPDSQDFYGGDYNELLSVKEKEGNIVDTEGKILGKHKGIWNYTVGQRKGIGIASTEALYVIELKKDTNEVIVGHADKTFKKSLIAVDFNWLCEPETNEFKSSAKIRSAQQPVNVTVCKKANGNVEIIFDEPLKSPAIGQSAVLYDNDTVLGGGIIDEVY